MDEEKKRQDFYNPHKSFWINANAGSGKTTVLTKRILALLIKGVEPGKIVVIAYTKTAAEELKERLIAKLRSFSQLGEEALKQELLFLSNNPDHDFLKKARGLIDVVQKSEVGIRIGTIHSFCLELIKKISRNKGQEIPEDIGSSFKMSKMQEVAYKKVVNYFASNFDFEGISKNRSLQDSKGMIDSFIRLFGASDAKKIIKEIISKRHWFLEKNLLDEFANNFGEKIMLLENDGELDFISYTKEISNILVKLLESEKAKVAITMSEKLKKWTPTSDEEKLHSIKIFLECFLVKGLDKVRSFSAIKGEAGRICLDVGNECLSFISKKNDAMIVRSNLVLFKMAEIVLEEISLFMKENSFMDFEGILLAALSGIKSSFAQGVVYDFFNNIHHLFIDEAQDVNFTSWDIFTTIISNIIENFSQSMPKSFFVVGDEKQSIFKFQGADVETFFKTRTKLEEMSKKAKFPMFCEDLQISYRSEKRILESVDEVFNRPEFLKSVSSSSAIVHIPYNADSSSGIVGYLEVPEKVSKEIDLGWEIKISPQTKEESLHIKYTSKLVKQIIDEGFLPKDIMIIVRNRIGAKNSVINLVEELKNQNIPASLDKFTINKHIIFYDFLSVCNFIKCPTDDMNLLSLLRSVFFSLDMREIEKIALRAKNGCIPMFNALEHERGEVFECLNSVLELSTKSVGSVFAFLLFKRKKITAIENLYNVDGLIVTNALVEKIYKIPSHHDINQVIDFLTEEAGHASVQAQGGGLRVITAHSAKGMESEVVILYDVGSKIDDIISSKVERIILHKNSPLLIKNMVLVDEKFKNAYDVARRLYSDEEKRILYVAMTRAKRRLYVVGECSCNLSWISVIKSLHGAEEVVLNI